MPIQGLIASNLAPADCRTVGSDACGAGHLVITLVQSRKPPAMKVVCYDLLVCIMLPGRKEPYLARLSA